MARTITYIQPSNRNTSIEIIDRLDSNSTSSALSANQGKVLNDKITNLSTNKVDKIDGKVLSTNDFTTEEKTKLSKLKNADVTKSYVDTELGKKANNNHEHSEYLTSIPAHRHDASEIDNLPTEGGMDLLSSDNIWTARNKFAKLVSIEQNGESQKMQPSTPNNPFYFAFYKNKMDRSCYFGYESSSNDDFVIVNESSNANINLKTNGSGQVQVNGKEIAKKEDLTSAIGSHKLWSGTQAEYDAIATKDNNTLYFIKEG